MAAAGVVAFLFFASSALAASVEETVRRGNEALEQGNFDEAIATYQQAAVDGPGRAELIYNQAVAHYRKGEYEQARGLFTQVIGSADGQLEAKARFNLGDCDYAEAVALAEKDKPAAIDRLYRAISHFRGALQANPSENGARANIELAQLLIKKLQQQQKQQQKQKQDQQKQQDQKDKKQSDENQQSENQQDDNQKSPQNQQQKDQQKNKGEQKQDESTKGDKQKGDEKEEPNKQEGKQGSEQSESQKQKQKQKQERDQEQGAEKQQQQDQPSKSPQDEEQQQPLQQQAGGEQQDSDNQVAQPQGMPQFGGKPTAEQESRPMTKEEAQKMLQAVRDRNLMRRLEQMEQRRSRHVPVDRDW